MQPILLESVVEKKIPNQKEGWCIEDPREQLNKHFVSMNSHYDAVSDLMYNWVKQRPDFNSAVRMVKMVQTTNVINFYGLQCDFMQKIERNTQKIKIADFTM